LRIISCFLYSVNEDLLLHGYRDCSHMSVSVQRLVEAGIPLEAENKEKETACDCAEKNGHGDIALFLESKMVFSLVSLFFLFFDFT